MRELLKTTFIAGIALMLAAAQVYGSAFTVFAGGPTPAPGDDILVPGPTPILTGVGFEVNAFSWGRSHMEFDFITGYEFSVDSASGGLPGSALAVEAGTGDQPADIYASAGGGSNVLLKDGNGSSAPTLTLVEPGPHPSGDNVDGWDNRGLSPTIYFSFGPVGLGPPTADILTAAASPGYDAAPSIYAGAVLLGLHPVFDDIDALVVFDGGILGTYDAPDTVLFSLTAGSAALGAASGTPYAGLGADDILIASAGFSGLHVAGSALGITPGGEMDALDVIPEPAVTMLIGLGGAFLLTLKRLLA